MKKSTSAYRVGPLYLVERGGYYHVNGTHDGKRIRAATKSSDLRSAKRFLDDMCHGLTSGWRQNALDGTTDWYTVATVICQRHRTHSKARGIPFGITKADVYKVMQAANFRCAVSGVAFSKRLPGETGPDPWSPSIDRIDNHHGYVRGNIRVVSTIANMAMNRWGYDTLLRLSHAVVLNASRPTPEKLTHQLISDNDHDTQVIENKEELAS
ncbi:hypothetical protein EJ076_35025 [Mesorhizobium sp. M7D.F.Ca.US.005.01.1.1]|uniref:hypothetical protein n=1 Tax=Mesorhizobium sp. M7D.F.Ca.US.005.01.1.1 TaxID=2493678 RepID=UPI000F74D925|nr:hypothetical protein [Mesorhizobium sp. M7D.F.Ca.US.005.01.1.1]AZO39699.1 hypothetical protein EJ076_00070 [Mesorhizobium sp. M7D.F.Ca.US.005.01.1.1]AZO45929.1 hypothetical protein EJ076_35025 [Mesorhizobium sp. M7D.F.Ca.US.005.01.1.1]